MVLAYNGGDTPEARTTMLGNYTEITLEHANDRRLLRWHRRRDLAQREHVGGCWWHELLAVTYSEASNMEGTLLLYRDDGDVIVVEGVRRHTGVLLAGELFGTDRDLHDPGKGDDDAVQVSPA